MSAWPQRRPQVQWVLFLLPVLLLLAWVGGDLLAVKGVETLRATVILTILSLASLLIFWMATGAELAEQLSRGQWPALPDYTGTEFVRLLTGLVYFVTGPTTYGATILWAWIGLLGMLFFYKAFTTAFPNGHRRLFMLMIFFYPSMLLWTSSISKDALVVFLLGMAAYGTARMKNRIDFPALWWLAVGVAGMLVVRPHIAGVFVVALAAFALTRPIRAGMMTPVIRLFSLLLFVAIAVAVVRTAAGFVRLESLAAQDLLEFIEVRRER